LDETLVCYSAFWLSVPAALAENRWRPRRSSFLTRTFPNPSSWQSSTAQKRGIARDHLIGLSISRTEEISRDEYDTMIRNRPA